MLRGAVGASSSCCLAGVVRLHCKRCGMCLHRLVAVVVCNLHFWPRGYQMKNRRKKENNAVLYARGFARFLAIALRVKALPAVAL